MNSMSYFKNRDLFARLFVIAKQNKMNFFSFSKAMLKSPIVKCIEDDIYYECFNKSLEDIFFDITSFRIEKDDSYGVYDDAYWSGFTYFELHQRTNYSFAFLFLKLPLIKMMELYSVYHEMDITELIEYLEDENKKKTIISLLLEEKGCSLSKVSKETGIRLPTLNKYRQSDETLLNASFQNVYRLAKYFDYPMELFLLAKEAK